jgi:rubrerythrin
MLKHPTPRKAIEFAVETEAMGKLFYEELADKFAMDTKIRDVFASMAKEEEIHERQFKAMLEGALDEPAWQSSPELLATLRATSMSEFFVGERGLYKQLDEIQSPHDAVERAFKLEKDTIGYYQAMRDAIGPSRILDGIIQAERLHLADLMELLSWNED